MKSSSAEKILKTNPRASNTSNGRTMILSKCAICGSKKSRFVKNQKAKGLLSNLGVRTHLSKVPIVGFLIGIHSMQGWTATTRLGVKRKEAQKKLQGTENLFRKNLQLKDVC